MSATGKLAQAMNKLNAPGLNEYYAEKVARVTGAKQILHENKRRFNPTPTRKTDIDKTPKPIIENTEDILNTKPGLNAPKNQEPAEETVEETVKRLGAEGTKLEPVDDHDNDNDDDDDDDDDDDNKDSYDSNNSYVSEDSYVSDGSETDYKKAKKSRYEFNEEGQTFYDVRDPDCFIQYNFDETGLTIELFICEGKDGRELIYNLITNLKKKNKNADFSVKLIAASLNPKRLPKGKTMSDMINEGNAIEIDGEIKLTDEYLTKRKEDLKTYYKSIGFLENENDEFIAETSDEIETATFQPHYGGSRKTKRRRQKKQKTKRRRNKKTKRKTKRRRQTKKRGKR
jgi:hypothetical protein